MISKENIKKGKIVDIMNKQGRVSRGFIKKVYNYGNKDFVELDNGQCGKVIYIPQNEELSPYDFSLFKKILLNKKLFLLKNNLNQTYFSNGQNINLYTDKKKAFNKSKTLENYSVKYIKTKNIPEKLFKYSGVYIDDNKVFSVNKFLNKRNEMLDLLKLQNLERDKNKEYYKNLKVDKILKNSIKAIIIILLLFLLFVLLLLFDNKKSYEDKYISVAKSFNVTVKKNKLLEEIGEEIDELNNKKINVFFKNKGYGTILGSLNPSYHIPISKDKLNSLLGDYPKKNSKPNDLELIPLNLEGDRWKNTEAYLVQAPLNNIGAKDKLLKLMKDLDDTNKKRKAEIIYIYPQNKSNGSGYSIIPVPNKGLVDFSQEVVNHAKKNKPFYYQGTNSSSIPNDPYLNIVKISNPLYLVNSDNKANKANTGNLPVLKVNSSNDLKDALLKELMKKGNQNKNINVVLDANYPLNNLLNSTLGKLFNEDNSNPLNNPKNPNTSNSNTNNDNNNPNGSNSSNGDNKPNNNSNDNPNNKNEGNKGNTSPKDDDPKNNNHGDGDKNGNNNNDDKKPLETIGGASSSMDDSPNRNNNVKKASDSLDGTIVQPDEEFSFLDKVNPITEDNGYKKAPVFNNGKKEEGVGGGVCQVSSTLYNALLSIGIKPTERNNHSIKVDYLPISLDAMVSNSGSDFKFKNTLDKPIIIHSHVNNNKLSIDIKSYANTNKHIVEYDDSNMNLGAKTYLLEYNNEGVLSNVEYLGISNYKN